MKPSAAFWTSSMSFRSNVQMGPQTDMNEINPNTIEETYELCDALMRMTKDIYKELGDVLLHIWHSMQRSVRRQVTSTLKISVMTSCATN